MPPLVPPLIALLGGILASPYLDIYFVWITFPLALLIAIARSRYAFLAIFLLGGILTSRQEIRPPEIPDDGYPVRIVAVLEGAPEYRAPGYYLNARILSVGEVEWWGRARLSYFPAEEDLERLFRQLDLGSRDRIEVLVRLRPPNSYRNPGAFDYRRYLEGQGVYWTGSIRNPRLIQVTDRGWHGGDLLRHWVTERIASHFEDGSTTQALVLGMVLGQQRRLPADDARKFRSVGLVHLLVVSGFNLALVAALALWLGRRIPLGTYRRTGSLIFALVVIWAYALLVDGQSPVVRATLMASLMLTGNLLDRGYAIWNALAATAIAILIIAPPTLADRSFQFTFLAVLGILLLSLPLIRWALGWVRPATRHLNNPDLDAHLDPEIADWRVSRRLWCELRGWPLWTATSPWKVGLILAEALCVTWGVQSLLLPLTVESYHQVSALTLPLNVVGALVAACITPMGLILIFLPQPLSGGVSWVMTRILDLFVWSVDSGIQLPGGSLRVPSPPTWIWILYAVVMTALMWALHRRSHSGVITAASLISILTVTIVLGDFSPTAPLHPTLTFIDVGQGDSALIELPDGKRIVVDGGGVFSGGYRSLHETGTFSIGEDVVSAYLFSLGLRRLDAIALTHAHHDHMDGLFDLIRNFEIGEVWLGNNPVVPRYSELIQEIYQHNIPIRWLAAGDRIGPFRVLNPPSNQAPASRVRNDDSLVLMLEWEGSEALLTGDLERGLIGLPDYVDVLKVPHHGSKNTQLSIQAGIPVISVGANNRFGHPDPSKLPALRTDNLGAIQVTLEPGGPEVAFPGL